MIEKKPEWLRSAVNNQDLLNMDALITSNHLNTVCNEANCPNRGECFKHHTATFMILGKYCTRHCRFCNVNHEAPQALEDDEADNLVKAVAKLNLRHVVITSVTRDDLPNGGAENFAKAVYAIRKFDPTITCELLIPDLQGSVDALKIILEAKPNVLAHNLETVPRLYPTVRPEANYRRSLDVLQNTKKYAPEIKTKTGIMVGLGETFEEVIQLMRDAKKSNCELITIGQYLRPSPKHLPVVEYIHPNIFKKYAESAKEIGFKDVMSAPLVRSSFHAEQML